MRRWAMFDLSLYLRSLKSIFNGYTVLACSWCSLSTPANTEASAPSPDFATPHQEGASVPQPRQTERSGKQPHYFSTYFFAEHSSTHNKYTPPHNGFSRAPPPGPQHPPNTRPPHPPLRTTPRINKAPLNLHTPHPSRPRRTPRIRTRIHTPRDSRIRRLQDRRRKCIPQLHVAEIRRSRILRHNSRRGIWRLGNGVSGALRGDGGVVAG